MKHGYMKLVRSERRRNYLVSEPNYHAAKFFTEHLLATDLRKTHILLNISFYLGLSILDLSKIVMYKFWYEYIKPKCGKNSNIYYMDIVCIVNVYVKTDDIYKDIGRPSPKAKHKNIVGLMEDELVGKVIKIFVELTAKIYGYLKDNNNEDKKSKKPKNVS